MVTITFKELETFDISNNQTIETANKNHQTMVYPTKKQLKRLQKLSVLIHLIGDSEAPLYDSIGIRKLFEPIEHLIVVVGANRPFEYWILRLVHPRAKRRRQLGSHLRIFLFIGDVLLFVWIGLEVV